MIDLQVEGIRGTGIRTEGQKGFVRVDLVEIHNIYDNRIKLDFSTRTL